MANRRLTGIRKRKKGEVCMRNFSVIALIAVIIFSSWQCDEMKRLEQRIVDKDNRLNEERTYTEIALKLSMSDARIWYIASTYCVSSLPDGQGENVYLAEGEKLLAVGNHLGVKRPERNKKVSFSLNKHREEETAYTVAGGWLVYKYVD